MPEVRLAVPTDHLHTNHAVRFIQAIFNLRVLIGCTLAKCHRAHPSIRRFCKARPPTVRLELGARIKKDFAANHAGILAIFKMIPVLTSEGAFGASFLSHSVLFGCEALA